MLEHFVASSLNRFLPPLPCMLGGEVPVPVPVPALSNL